jgi:hypothetical protein
VGDVHHGDVNHIQQIAVLQYLQLLAQPPHGPVAPHALARRGGTNRHVRPFSLPLTDPNNPWGFDFPPTVLVK